MYKLTVFIPDDFLEQVKSALFQAGAGRIGAYGECCWQVKGQGQFRPLTGSAPHTGTVGELEHINEWRVEMVVADELIEAVISALKQAHPFEVPAYDVVQVIDI